MTKGLFINHTAWQDSFKEEVLALIDKIAGKLDFVTFAIDKNRSLNMPGYVEELKEVVNYARAKGLKIVANLHVDSALTVHPSYELVNNPETYGRDWINWGVAVIETLNPDYIEIMDEPRKGSGIGWDLMKRFIESSKNTYQTVKPDIQIMVSYFDFKPFETWLPSGIILDAHMYYTQDYSYSDFSTQLQLLLASGDIDGARTHMFTFFDDFFGTVPFSKVSWGFATNRTSFEPHWKDYMNLMKEYFLKKGFHDVWMFISGVKWNFPETLEYYLADVPPVPPPQCMISFLLPLALGSIRLTSLSNLRLLRNKLSPQFATDKYHHISKEVIKCIVQ